MLNIQVTAQALFDADAMIVDKSLTRHLNTELVSTVNDAAFTHNGHRGLNGTNIHTGSPNGGTTWGEFEKIIENRFVLIYDIGVMTPMS
ncbi:hypothetical protein N9X60_05070 [Paracoccaceae bacterium]|nr:hypothetical protein [Paracoccaceae bacterium]